VPQIATLGRLARRLGIVISRSVIAADGEFDLDLWVRAEPVGDEVELAITGWKRRPPPGPAIGTEAERETDFLRATADWMWETDEAMRITRLSPAGTAAAGKEEGALIGKPLTRLFRLVEAEDGTLPILDAVAEQRRFDGQLADLRGRKGRFVLGAVALIDGAGRFAGFRGSARSLPEEGKARADAAKTGVVPVLVDPAAFGERLNRALRQPLDHIITQADTISAQPDGPLQGDYAGYGRDIAAAGRHLLELVDDLVDLHAIERPDFVPEIEEIDLADLARRAAGLMSVRASSRKVRIDRPGEEQVLAATGEFKRVLQILMNLLTNAIRYSPEGGRVRIEAERRGDFACLIVADQGPGIGEADQDRIFDKFERLDPAEAGGTGLGLYIARRLARAMGGDLRVDSAPGEGSRFTLRLPART
jgi:signal transduction histidine kinase